MKRALYFILIIIMLPIVCSFENSTVGNECVVFSKPNGEYFYILDTLNSTYTYCETTRQDSVSIVGKEVFTGYIENTDSVLITSVSKEPSVTVILSYSKHIKKNESFVLTDKYGIESIKFYDNSDSCKLKYTLNNNIDNTVIKSEKRSGSSVYLDLRMNIKALQIEFFGEQPPIINLDSLDEFSTDYFKRIRNTYITCSSDCKKKKKCNFINIIIDKCHPTSSKTRYYWKNKDSLGRYVSASLGPTHYYIALIREKRHVSTFKNDSSIVSMSSYFSRDT